jgi:hypothetical protein
MFRDFEIPKGTRSIKEIEQGFAEGLYKGTWEDFQKTLTAIVLRIPSTNKQSFMAAKIVGFANDFCKYILYKHRSIVFTRC